MKPSQKAHQFFSPLRRILSAWVLIAFIATNCFPLPVHAAEVSIPDAMPESLPRDLSAVHIPQEFGKVQEFFQGKGDKVVVLVQDAHAIADAQRNIQKIIGHFQTRYGLALIALEGASSKLDAQIFRSFPDQELLRKIFEEYLEKGELTGSTAAAIFSPARALYHGVEDWGLYEEGLGLYLKAVETDAGIFEKINSLQNELQKQKESTYSKELLELDGLLSGFRENHAYLTDLLPKLAQLQAPEAGTELALLIEEIKGGKENRASIRCGSQKHGAGRQGFPGIREGP